MSIQQAILKALVEGKTLKAVDAHAMFKCQENTFIRCIYHLRHGVNCDKPYPVKSAMVEVNGKTFSQYWLERDKPAWYEAQMRAKASYEHAGKTEHIEYKKICEELKAMGY